MSKKLWIVSECICEQVPINTRLLIYSDDFFHLILEKSKDGYKRYIIDKKSKVEWDFDIRDYLIKELNMLDLSDSILSHLDL
jgi:hypothetical protein